MTSTDIIDLQALERTVVTHLNNTGLFPATGMSELRKRLKKIKATKLDIPAIFQNREVITKISSYYE